MWTQFDFAKLDQVGGVCLKSSMCVGLIHILGLSKSQKDLAVFILRWTCVSFSLLWPPKDCKTTPSPSFTHTCIQSHLAILSLSRTAHSHTSLSLHLTEALNMSVIQSTVKPWVLFSHKIRLLPSIGERPARSGPYQVRFEQREAALFTERSKERGGVCEERTRRMKRKKDLQTVSELCRLMWEVDGHFLLISMDTQAERAFMCSTDEWPQLCHIHAETSRSSQSAERQKEREEQGQVEEEEKIFYIP